MKHKTPEINWFKCNETLFDIEHLSAKTIEDKKNHLMIMNFLWQWPRTIPCIRSFNYSSMWWWNNITIPIKSIYCELNMHISFRDSHDHIIFAYFALSSCAINANQCKYEWSHEQKVMPTLTMCHTIMKRFSWFGNLNNWNWKYDRHSGIERRWDDVIIGAAGSFKTDCDNKTCIHHSYCAEVDINPREARIWKINGLLHKAHRRSIHISKWAVLPDRFPPFLQLLLIIWYECVLWISVLFFLVCFNVGQIMILHMWHMEAIGIDFPLFSGQSGRCATPFSIFWRWKNGKIFYSDSEALKKPRLWWEQCD